MASRTNFDSSIVTSYRRDERGSVPRSRIYMFVTLIVVECFLNLILPTRAAERSTTHMSSAPAFKPINPASLPSSSIDTDFAPAEAAKLKASFAAYIAYVHAHGDHLDRLPSTQSLRLKTVSGQVIDSKELFLRLNNVQSHLTKNGLSLANPDLPRVVPLSKAFPTATPFVQIRPASPPAAPLPIETATPSPKSIPVSATRCSPKTPEPKIFDSDRGWVQIGSLSSNRAADGTKLARCSLDFEPQLTQVESGSPKGIVPDIEVTTPPIGFGKTNVASGSFVNDVAVRKSGNLLSLDSSLQASVIGQDFDVLKLAASVNRTDPQTMIAQFSFSVGEASVYNVKDSINPNYTFHVTPTKVVNIVPPFRQKFGPTSFEVDCKGMVGVDGKVVTTPYGFLISAKPSIVVQVDGGLSVNYVFVDGSLSGTLDLVDSQGELGGIAALLVDPTAPQFDPSFTTPPLVAIVRPFGFFTTSALKSSLAVKIRLAGNVTVFSQSVPISGGLRAATVAITSPWSVYYVAPGSPVSPTPAATP